MIIEAGRSAELDRNQEVVLAIRPERITLLRGALPEGGGYRGIVEDTIYVGEAIKYVIRLSEGVAVVAKQQRRSDAPPLKRGDPVGVTWDRGDVRAFPAHPEKSGGVAT